MPSVNPTNANHVREICIDLAVQFAVASQKIADGDHAGAGQVLSRNFFKIEEELLLALQFSAGERVPFRGAEDEEDDEEEDNDENEG